jgi:peptide/nickel transport system substrate-binding protein
MSISNGGPPSLHDFAISRRGILKGIAGAGLLLPFADASFAQTAPKKGGKLVVALNAWTSSDTLDPGNFYDGNNAMVGFAVYDLLVNRAPDLKPMPWLAESWEPNADASEWVFKLRSDVTFHSGKRFGADDVIYSYTRLKSDKSTSPTKAFMSQIKEMKKVDEHTVRFVLEAPNADLPITFSDTRVHIVEDGATEFLGKASGTGPFKVKTFEPAQSYVLTRNDHYWGSGGPYVDEIEYVGIPDRTARVNALLSGDVDILMDLDPTAVPVLKAKPDMVVLNAKSGTHVNVAMMLDMDPTSKNDVRLAMKYALDREAIVQNVYKGFGVVGNDHPIAPIDPFYNKEIPQRPYDPDKARFHIKKAGLENTKLPFYTSDAPRNGCVAATQIYQQSAAKCGINLDLQQIPADSYWEKVWIKQPMLISSWDGRPVPDLILSIAYKTGGDYNETHWKNEKFDKLLVEGRGTLDFAKRYEIYGECQRMLQDDGGVAVMTFLDILDAHASHVKGIKAHPSGNLDFFQFATNVWIDA